MLTMGWDEPDTVESRILEKAGGQSIWLHSAFLHLLVQWTNLTMMICSQTTSRGPRHRSRSVPLSSLPLPLFEGWLTNDKLDQANLKATTRRKKRGRAPPTPLLISSGSRAIISIWLTQGIRSLRSFFFFSFLFSFSFHSCSIDN